MKSKIQNCTCQNNPSQTELAQVQHDIDEIYSYCLNHKGDLDIFFVRYVVRYLARARACGAIPYHKREIKPVVIRRLVRAMMTYEDIMAICGGSQRDVENEELAMIEEYIGRSKEESIDRHSFLFGS